MDFVFDGLLAASGALFVCLMLILAVSMVIMLGVLICLTARSLWQTPWRFGLRSLLVVAFVWCSALGILRAFDASQSLILLITSPIIVALVLIPILDFLQDQGKLKAAFDMRSFRESQSGEPFSLDDVDWESVTDDTPVQVKLPVQEESTQEETERSTKVKWWLKPQKNFTHIGRYSFRTPD